jgi:hypothetical protein
MTENPPVGAQRLRRHAAAGAQDLAPVQRERRHDGLVVVQRVVDDRGGVRLVGGASGGSGVGRDGWGLSRGGLGRVHPGMAVEGPDRLVEQVGWSKVA